LHVQVLATAGIGDLSDFTGQALALMRTAVNFEIHRYNGHTVVEADSEATLQIVTAFLTNNHTNA
jgi:hypothetical protein